MKRLLLATAALAIALGFSLSAFAGGNCSGGYDTQTVSTPAPVDTAETGEPASDGSG